MIGVVALIGGGFSAAGVDAGGFLSGAAVISKVIIGVVALIGGGFRAAGVDTGGLISSAAVISKVIIGVVLACERAVALVRCGFGAAPEAAHHDVPPGVSGIGNGGAIGIGGDGTIGIGDGGSFGIGDGGTTGVGDALVKLYA